MSAMPRYLVTGAAGFIGARTAELLLDDGHEVIGVDELNDAYDPRVKEWRLARLCDRPGFSFARVNVAEAASITELIAGSGPLDAVVNLAARAGVRQSVANPALFIDTNTRGTANLLDACARHSIPKFVLASTSSLYGAHNQAPYREDADTSRPLSPYAASKKAAEVLAHAYHHLYGLDVTVFRYFTVYGPAGRPDMSLFRFVQWVAEDRPVVVYGDGTQTRDFTYVDDIARGTVAGLAHVGYEVVNLGSDDPIELGVVLAEIERLVGKSAKREFREAHRADVPRSWADITQASRLLGWEPKTTWREGVANLVEWYLVNREWASQLDTVPAD